MNEEFEKDLGISKVLLSVYTRRFYISKNFNITYAIKAYNNI